MEIDFEGLEFIFEVKNGVRPNAFREHVRQRVEDPELDPNGKLVIGIVNGNGTRVFMTSKELKVLQSQNSRHKKIETTLEIIVPQFN